MTLVQVFLQKKSKGEGKHLKSNFQENSLTLRMIEYLSNCQVRLNTSKVITCCGYFVRVWIRNVKIIPIQAHWSSTLHLPAFLLQLHGVTSYALSMKLPSCLHCRLHSWVPHYLNFPWPSLAFKVQHKCICRWNLPKYPTSSSTLLHLLSHWSLNPAFQLAKSSFASSMTLRTC